MNEESKMASSKRVFIGGLATETNTFAPFPTGKQGFEEYGIRRDVSQAGDSIIGGPLKTWRLAAEADGHAVIETITCFAQPSGKTVDAVYEQLRDTILADLRAALPVDIVLLMLHGAMVAQGYDDCEGDLISRVRAIVPDAAIGIELDPHCHMTAQMLGGADVIILAKEYPHIDFSERAAELYDLCHRKSMGAVAPVAALADTRMVGFYPTFDPPMIDIVAELRALEQEPGILSASIVHGFPWADVATLGTRVLVYADGDEAAAIAGAERLAARLYAARHALTPDYPDIDHSLSLGREKNGQVVLGDFADNAGGGASGDSTFFLRAILDRGLTDVAIGAIWDPMVAQICAEAGIGAVMDIRLGGKSGPASGDAVDLRVEVRNVLEAHDQGVFGQRQPLGRSVWLHSEGVDILVCSVRTQVFERDAFTGIGIELANKRLVVVKSSNHYQAGFREEADHIWNVRTPGTMNLDFAGMPYTKRTPDFFPREDDPWARLGKPATEVYR
jgi:microcystin degradation protein MlrC